MRSDAQSPSEAAPSINSATFRDDQSKEDNRAATGNGAGHRNGQAHPGRFEESSGEGLAVPHEAAVELEDEAGPPSAPKPRGSKRGWWQRRAE
jgi:hypothetical protein